MHAFRGSITNKQQHAAIEKHGEGFPGYISDGVLLFLVLFITTVGAALAANGTT